MKVTIAELRVMAEIIFAHLEETGRDEFHIDEDFYWVVDENELYNPLEDPGELTLGQLSDDWKELCAILKREENPSGQALVWLSSILRRVGEKTVW